MKLCRHAILLAVVINFHLLGGQAQSLVVFTNGFDGTMPGQIESGVATLTGVQGYAGLGPSGNKFGGSFLRSPTGNPVTLTVSNLPPHNTLNLGMLFAAIDSLDGTGSFPSGDFFQVKIGTDSTDGTVVFRESFANADPGQFQSYVPPPGAELARRVDLGFRGPGGFYTDSAYNFAVDSRFSHLAHTGSVAVISFLMEGPGVQPLDDESWAIDNLSVSLSGLETPVITQILAQTNQLLLTWSALSNRNYVVESCTNLANPFWVDVLPAVTATNTAASSIQSAPTGNRFYRVKLLVP
jgi:hypothetical protein